MKVEINFASIVVSVLSVLFVQFIRDCSEQRKNRKDDLRQVYKILEDTNDELLNIIFVGNNYIQDVEYVSIEQKLPITPQTFILKLDNQLVSIVKLKLVFLIPDLETLKSLIYDYNNAYIYLVPKNFSIATYSNIKDMTTPIENSIFALLRDIKIKIEAEMDKYNVNIFYKYLSFINKEIHKNMHSYKLK
jgi:hypothetical protein